MEGMVEGIVNLALEMEGFADSVVGLVVVGVEMEHLGGILERGGVVLEIEMGLTAVVESSYLVGGGEGGGLEDFSVDFDGCWVVL